MLEVLKMEKLTDSLRIPKDKLHQVWNKWMEMQKDLNICMHKQRKLH